MDVRAWNGREALMLVANKVLEEGQLVRPRDLETKELRHLSVEIENPYDVLCTGIGRRQSREVAAAEAIQLIGAFSEPEFAIEHAPPLTQFLNEEGYFDGAYGPRASGLYEHVLRKLETDPDTRQAVIPVWESADTRRRESRDYPCTLNLTFFLRDGLLELDVTMRSNDVWLGFTNDIFQFTQLQLSFAHLLGTVAGPYRHTAYSMHLYAPDWEKVDRLEWSRRSVTIPDHPAGVQGKDVTDMRARAYTIAMYDYVDFHLTPSELWYREALGY